MGCVVCNATGATAGGRSEYEPTRDGSLGQQTTADGSRQRESPRRDSSSSERNRRRPSDVSEAPPEPGVTAAAPPPSETPGSTRTSPGGVPRVIITPAEDIDPTPKSRRRQSPDEHAPFYARYGVTKRTVSTARLRKGENIWKYYEDFGRAIGSGVSGEVRLVRRIATKEEFAMKKLCLDSIKPSRVASLHNEVAVYLQLDHPNIAKLIEVYEDKTAIFIVMELCRGKELYDRLYSKKRYSERDAAKVAVQMLSAINYCHLHHVCHRDLKLENWVFEDDTEDAKLKLIDFGFSRIFNPGIPMTAMHGTVYYVSPEVMEGSYGEKCDLWSIGVIVYMLLSGTPPFKGSADHEILLNIRKGRYDFSGARWEGTSGEAKLFISRLLQKNPRFRPSASDALKDSWLWKEEPNQAHAIDPQVLYNLKEFAAGNVVKRAALGLVAFSSTSEQRGAIEKQFRMLDVERRGTIQLHQMVKVLSDNLDLEPEEARRVFNKLDQTGDRHVHYSEFLAATMQARLTRDDHLVRCAFDKFDVDGTGFISSDNLKVILGESYDGVSMEEILRTWDSTGRGVLTYDDFLSALCEDTPDDQRPGGQPEFNVMRKVSQSLAHLAVSAGDITE